MKFLIVAAARPNFVKVASILGAFGARLPLNGTQVLLVHTGQHYDRRMSDDFFQDLGIPEPDINLGVGSGTHAEQTASVMIAFEKICCRERPDWTVVVGDVNSTMACAITAKKLGIRVAHVEAGLRSFDMSMPEEVNRLCTDAISDLLFTTDRVADSNLRREGVAENKIHFVGNTMIDTLLRHISRARAYPLPDGLRPGSYAVLTLHRPGNVDSPKTLGPLLNVVADFSRRMDVVFPVHPRTFTRIQEFGLMDLVRSSGIRFIEPLSYLPFVGLVARSRFVMTDSGGIQEETTALGVPCLTLRHNTERPITVSEGTNLVVGNDPEVIKREALSALGQGSPPRRVPELWDGKAAVRVVDAIEEAALRVR